MNLEDDMELEELGTLVKARRKQKNLNQLDLAAMSGVSDRFIRELEHGKTSLRLDKLVLLLRALDLKLDIIRADER